MVATGYMTWWVEKQFKAILGEIGKSYPDIMTQVHEILPGDYYFGTQEERRECFGKAIQQIIEAYPSMTELLKISSATEVSADLKSGGANLLHIVAVLGDKNAVERLLNHNEINRIELNQKAYHHSEGYTALDFAAFNGNIGFMRLLLDKGAQGTFINMLCSAAYHHRFAVMQFLLGQKWDKNLNASGHFMNGDSQFRNVPINLATEGFLFGSYGNKQYKRKGIDFIALLLRYGASPNTSYQKAGITQYRDTPLHIIAKYRPREDLDEYERCLLELLIANGANPFTLSSDGRSIEEIASWMTPSFIKRTTEETQKYWHGDIFRGLGFLETSKDINGNQLEILRYDLMARWRLMSEKKQNEWVASPYVTLGLKAKNIPPEIHDQILDRSYYPFNDPALKNHPFPLGAEKFLKEEKQLDSSPRPTI